MTTPRFEQATSSPSRTLPGRLRRIGLRGSIITAAVAAASVAAIVPASAEPGDTDTGGTEANVEVSTSIQLTGLTPSFTLTGIPGATVTGLGSVVLNVQTNNLAGYAVTVQSQTATLVAGAPGNADSIPIGALSVRETGTTPYTALSSATTATVHSQAGRSAEGGDSLSNDYVVTIPFVNEDTYTATLDYVATTL